MPCLLASQQQGALPWQIETTVEKNGGIEVAWKQIRADSLNECLDCPRCSKRVVWSWVGGFGVWVSFLTAMLVAHSRFKLPNSAADFQKWRSRLLRPQGVSHWLALNPCRLVDVLYLPCFDGNSLKSICRLSPLCSSHCLVDYPCFFCACICQFQRCRGSPALNILLWKFRASHRHSGLDPVSNWQWSRRGNLLWPRIQSASNGLTGVSIGWAFIGWKCIQIKMFQKPSYLPLGLHVYLCLLLQYVKSIRLAASNAPLLDVVRRAQPSHRSHSFALFAVLNTALLNLSRHRGCYLGCHVRLLPAWWPSTTNSLSNATWFCLAIFLFQGHCNSAGTTAAILAMFCLVNLSLLFTKRPPNQRV